MTKDRHRRRKDQLIEDDSERLGYRSGGRRERACLGRGDDGTRFGLRKDAGRNAMPLDPCSNVLEQTTHPLNNHIPSIQVSHILQILSSASKDHAYVLTII